MCGISGYYSKKKSILHSLYYNSHQKIAHRGPDDEGFAFLNTNGDIIYGKGDDTISSLGNYEHVLNHDSSRVMLGHRRLSIIDLSELGHQPLFYDNLLLTYNGEIYNYIELKKELENLGYKFSTNTDTEVFLKAYHCWGNKAFNKFNGMWAAVIYNYEKDSILLTRDRFGIKPLYYMFFDDTLFFGSEIKYLSCFLKEKKINESLVYSYITDCHLEHTDETFIKGIYSLSEGSYIEYSNNLNQHRYYKLEERSVIEIEKSLLNSIKLRMRSDVEVGALLSGGIDSTLLVCMLNYDLNHKKLETFTADFSESSFSERIYVEDTLRKTNYNGNFVHISAKKILNNMSEMMYVQETPVRSMSVFLQYEIFKYISENTNVKVTLSGQGADEIFSGYNIDPFYNIISYLLSGNYINFCKELYVQKVKNKFSLFGIIYKLLKIYIKEDLKLLKRNRLFNKRIKHKKYKKKFQNYLKDKLYKGLSFSALKEYLRDEDKNSMRFSIESRLPFMDYNIIEQAFSMKNNDFINRGITKIQLRKIADKRIPKSISSRRDKMGFISPQEVWQRNELREDFDRVFNDIETNGLLDFIDTKQASKIYREYRTGTSDNWSLVWRLYCLFYYKSVWGIKN